MASRDNILLSAGVAELASRLPAGWSVTPEGRPGDTTAVRLAAPDGRSVRVEVQARLRVTPRDVIVIADAGAGDGRVAPRLLISRFLSDATRARLRERGIGYADTTGNVWLTLSEPGLFIEARGAANDPERTEQPARSLRGATAGRIVRALVDAKKLPTVRAIAAAATTDPGYVSRVLAFLDTEGLVTRVGHGRLAGVDWVGLLRRWAQDAPLESRGLLLQYFEPRGIPPLIARLAGSSERYAVTAELAAATRAPVAPTRLAMIWIRDAPAAAARLGLRQTDAGTNVLLLEPNDEGVFIGAAQRDGVWYAAPSQAAADLLTSPGRGPAEAEALLEWMRGHEEEWRG